MIQKYVRYRILQEFFDYPTKEFHIREIGRRVKLTQPAVTNHLKALVREGLILKEKKGLYPTFKADRDKVLFKIYKRNDIILRMQENGCIGCIYDTFLPNAIFLFGSASRGEDTEESDIDIFVEAKEKKINLEKYEKILKRKISLFFQEEFTNLSNELKNNILNGIVLKGYLKVF